MFQIIDFQNFLYLFSEIYHLSDYLLCIKANFLHFNLKIHFYNYKSKRQKTSMFIQIVIFFKTYLFN